MKSYKSTTVGNKIVLVTLITSVFAVLLMFVGVALYEFVSYEARSVKAFEIKARKVAATLTPIVSLNNNQYLQRSLPILATDKELRSVVIFDLERIEIASFQVAGTY